VLTGGVGTWIRVLVTPAFSEKSRSRGSATNWRTESQVDGLTMSMRVEEKGRIGTIMFFRLEFNFICYSYVIHSLSTSFIL